MFYARGFITRSLGLDIGDKRIGVALSDPGGILASPLTIIERRDDWDDIRAVTDIIEQYQVEKIVVGLPLSMNGTAGKQAGRVQDFAGKLGSNIKVPVEFRDERLTTVLAKRQIKADKSKKTRGRTRDDAVAAAFILQSYLDEADGDNVTDDR